MRVKLGQQCGMGEHESYSVPNCLLDVFPSTPVDGTNPQFENSEIRHIYCRVHILCYVSRDGFHIPFHHACGRGLA